MSIPNEGLVTGDELLAWLGLKTLSHLHDELERRGIKHVKVCRKRIYRCEDLRDLFGSAE